MILTWKMPCPLVVLILMALKQAGMGFKGPVGERR